MSAPSTPSAKRSASSGATKTWTRPSPFLPSRSERLLVAAFAGILLFGSLFSLLNPATRHPDVPLPNDALHAHAHHDQRDPKLAPSYFARKDNVFNVWFVKRGWAWVSLAVWAVLVARWLSVVQYSATQASQQQGSRTAAGGSAAAATAAAIARKTLRRQTLQALARWALATSWWVLVTQWAFGPPLIDRGFRFTGGKCNAVAKKVESDGDVLDVLSAAACRAAGGHWDGGHDISGHVFLLVLGSAMLLEEVGWTMAFATAGRAKRAGGDDKLAWWESPERERSVVMADGSIRLATVEGYGGTVPLPVAGGWGVSWDWGVKAALGVVALSWWMLLMTAIYFHTWFEKVRIPSSSSQ